VRITHAARDRKIALPSDATTSWPQGFAGNCIGQRRNSGAAHRFADNAMRLMKASACAGVMVTALVFCAARAATTLRRDRRRAQSTRARQTEIRQRFQIAHRFGAHLSCFDSVTTSRSGASTHSAAHMTAGRSDTAAGRMKSFSAGRSALKPSSVVSDARYPRRDHRHARNAQLAAQIEQVVLCLGQCLAHIGRNLLRGTIRSRY